MAKGSRKSTRSVAPSWKEATLREEQHSAKRRLILNQAARMFADFGFHQTTIEQIAAALQVTKPTIYYYIESKEDILYQILQVALLDLDESLQSRMIHDMKAIDKLENFFEEYTKIILSDFGVCMVLVTDRSLNADYRKKLRTLKKEFELRVRSIIADGQKDGTIFVDDSRTFANAIFGAYNWMPQWFSSAGSASPEEVGAAIFRLFRRAASQSAHSIRGV